MVLTPTSVSMDTDRKKRFILEFRSAKANSGSDNLVCRTFDGYIGTEEWLIISGDFTFVIYDLKYFITARIIIKIYALNGRLHQRKYNFKSGKCLWPMIFLITEVASFYDLTKHLVNQTRRFLSASLNPVSLHSFNI